MAPAPLVLRLDFAWMDVDLPLDFREGASWRARVTSQHGGKLRVMGPGGPVSEQVEIAPGSREDWTARGTVRGSGPYRLQIIGAGEVSLHEVEVESAR